MILESGIDGILRRLAMTEYAEIDTKTVICDAYADLVSGDAPVLLGFISEIRGSSKAWSTRNASSGVADALSIQGVLLLDR